MNNRNSTGNIIRKVVREEQEPWPIWRRVRETAAVKQTWRHRKSAKARERTGGRNIYPEGVIENVLNTKSSNLAKESLKDKRKELPVKWVRVLALYDLKHLTVWAYERYLNGCLNGLPKRYITSPPSRRHLERGLNNHAGSRGPDKR